jgi:hypothetical protein
MLLLIILSLLSTVDLSPLLLLISHFHLSSSFLLKHCTAQSLNFVLQGEVVIICFCILAEPEHFIFLDCQFLSEQSVVML